MCESSDKKVDEVNDLDTIIANLTQDTLLFDNVNRFVFRAAFDQCQDPDYGRSLVIHDLRTGSCRLPTDEEIEAHEAKLERLKRMGL